MDDAPWSKELTDESACVKRLLDSKDSKCVCARGTDNTGISPWKEVQTDKKPENKRTDIKSKNVTPRRHCDRKEKPLEYSFHHYQDSTMYALQYRKEHTQGSSENEEKLLLGLNIPDPYLPTTLNASVLEERMRLIEAISEYYHKQSNLQKACVNLTGAEQKSARQERSSELPRISSAKKPSSGGARTSSKHGMTLECCRHANGMHYEKSNNSEEVLPKKTYLNSPRFHWMDSIAKGDFHEVGASQHRNPKQDIEYDSVINNRRYFLTPTCGLNPGNLYVGNSPLPFKPVTSNVSKCEVFSSSEVPKTPRIDTKPKPNSIIAVIGHSTGDIKTDASKRIKKKEKKGDHFEYYNRFEPSKPVSNALSRGKVHTQASIKRSSMTCSETSARLGSAGLQVER